MKKLLLIFQLTVLSCTTYAQAEWTKFGELPNLFNQHKKAILLFIHTDWCKVCKMQESTVFNDDSLSKALNENFYLLKLNAEEKKDIEFFGRKYKGATANHFHELAEYLGKKDGQLIFPTTIILNEKFQLIYHNSAFVSKEVF